VVARTARTRGVVDAAVRESWPVELAPADVLAARVAAREVGAVIVELDGESSASPVLPVMLAAADQHRPVPVVLYVRRVSPLLPGRLLALVAPGLRVAAVIDGRRGAPPVAALRRAVKDALREPPPPPGVEPTLLHHFVPIAPPPIQTFVALAALTAAGRYTVAELAGWCGVDPRTIGRALQSAGWAEARVVVQTFRALGVAWLMGVYRCSAGYVAAVRGQDASAQTRLTRHYLGVTPAMLQKGDAFDDVLARAKDRLTSDAT